MPITQEQVDGIIAIRDQWQQVVSDGRSGVKLLDEVLERVDLENPFNHIPALPELSGIVSAYIGPYGDAYSALQASVGAVTPPP